MKWVIDLVIDIQTSTCDCTASAKAQGLSFVSNTFIFMDENAERIGTYSQRVLKQNSTPELGGALKSRLDINGQIYICDSSG